MQGNHDNKDSNCLAGRSKRAAIGHPRYHFRLGYKCLIWTSDLRCTRLNDGEPDNS